MGLETVSMGVAGVWVVQKYRLAKYMPLMEMVSRPTDLKGEGRSFLGGSRLFRRFKRVMRFTRF